MDVREWFNKHPKTTAASGGVCLLICIGAISMEIAGNQKRINPKLPNHFYTADDGKTFFEASSSNVAPFEHNGATAVRAYVFDCSGKQFVGYLERYTAEARKVEMSGGPVPVSVESYGRELKKPGDTKWVSTDGNDPAALSRVAKVRCASGSNDRPMPIEPD